LSILTEWIRAGLAPHYNKYQPEQTAQERLVYAGVRQHEAESGRAGARCAAGATVGVEAENDP
jgi:hypothetical protein